MSNGIKHGGGTGEMKKFFMVFLMLIFVTPIWAGGTVANIKNSKGQNVGSLRESHNKVEVLNKNGFVQGWVDTRSGKTYNKNGFNTGAIQPIRTR